MELTLGKLDMEPYLKYLKHFTELLHLQIDMEPYLQYFKHYTE